MVTLAYEDYAEIKKVGSKIFNGNFPSFFKFIYEIEIEPDATKG